MEQLRLIALLLKCFLRNRKLLWLYGIGTFAFLLLTGLILLPGATMGSADAFQFLHSLYLSFVSQIAFIVLFVVAVEFSREVFDKEGEFLFRVRDYGQLKAASATLAVLLLLWAIILVLALAVISISAIMANLFSVEIANVVAVTMLRLGGTTLVLVLMGLFLGRVAKRFIAYGLIIGTVLLLSPMVGFMIDSILLEFELSDTLRLLVYWIFLAPFELSAMASIASIDSIYLIPNELHQWLLPMIWILAFLAGIVASLRWSKCSSILVVMLAFGLMAAPWAVQGSRIALPRYSAAPHSIDDRALRPEVFTSDWWQNPPAWDYLYPIPVVANYEIDLDIRSRLSGRVVMTLEEPFSRTPTFTLFRGYHLSSITNLEGKQLDFSREGNHITILTPGQDSTMGFIFEYAGSGWGHYANSQGIFLPGNFPWYPWPGKQRFYWDDARFQTFHFSRIGDVYGFEVRVNSRHPEVFTPHGVTLTQSEKFTSIPTEALTLIAGQVQRVGDADTLSFYSGIRALWVYEDPNFEDAPDITDRAIRQQVRERAYELREVMGIENPHTLNATSFVMVPEFPAFSNLYWTPIYLGDHIVLHENAYVDLSLALALQDIVRTCEKRDVYETLFAHLVQDEWIFQEMPLVHEMTELIHAEGEERAIQLIVEYLMDDTITLSGEEFFYALLEEQQ